MTNSEIYVAELTKIKNVLTSKVNPQAANDFEKLLDKHIRPPYPTDREHRINKLTFFVNDLIDLLDKHDIIKADTLSKQDIYSLIDDIDSEWVEVHDNLKKDNPDIPPSIIYETLYTYTILRIFESVFNVKLIDNKDGLFKTVAIGIGTVIILPFWFIYNIFKFIFNTLRNNPLAWSLFFIFLKIALKMAKPYLRQF